MGRGGVFSVDSLSGIYVLVVCGEKDRLALMTGVLRYCGALVTPVDTTDGAFAVMEILMPDAIVVEFPEPDEARGGVIERLRAGDDSGRLVVTVGIGAADLTDEARDRGFDAYIEIPFDPWELCRIISTLVTT